MTVAELRALLAVCPDDAKIYLFNPTGDIADGDYTEARDLIERRDASGGYVLR